MKRVSVQSSNIRSIGYDSSTSILEVEFRDHSIYHYFGVPSQVHVGLMTAASHGSYLHAIVKKGGYHYIKVSR